MDAQTIDTLLGLAFLVFVLPGGPFLFILFMVHMEKKSCNKGGPAHSWEADQTYFQARVCCNCGRRELLTREWEFIDYVKVNKHD
jgi:hypothetical protein